MRDELLGEVPLPTLLDVLLCPGTDTMANPRIAMILNNKDNGRVGVGIGFVGYQYELKDIYSCSQRAPILNSAISKYTKVSGNSTWLPP